MKKVLLDENLPKQLKHYLSDELEIFTVFDLDWQTKKNGELMAEMDNEKFDFLLKADKNLRYQQNLDKYNVRVAVLLTHDNRLKTLITKISEIKDAILFTTENMRVIEIDIRN